MAEEIKYMGSTKKEIWDAYKETKAELTKLKANEPVSTTERANKDAVSSAVKNASGIDTSTIETVLTKLVEGVVGLKKEYDDLVTAIGAKKAELKEVHGIEVSANDLAALAAVKEKLIADKDEEAKKIIADAEEKKKEADEYYRDTIKKTNEEAEKITEKQDIERAREEEQYNYDTTRNRRKDADKVADELELKSKSLDQREKEVGEREKIANEKDSKIDELSRKIENLEKSIQDKIDEAFTNGEEKAKKSAQFQANMVKSHTDAEAKIAQSTIANLEAKVVDLEKQINRANEAVLSANEKVATMAQAALKAQGDAATISEVSKIAAGSNKSK